MTSRSLTVGSVEVTAVCDVAANFPEPFGTVTRSGDGRRWSGRP